MSDPRTIITALQSCKTILISVHKSPDGDALGSQIALMLALEKMGKTVTAHNLDPVPEIYRFLPHQNRISFGPVVAGRFDAMMVLDADPPRTGLFANDYPAATLINIDHHITNPVIWPITWLDAGASATGEMIYQLITQAGLPLDRDMALCLYTAIFTDTGSFRYSNTSPQCMRIAATLLEAGADPWLVTENVYESYSFNRLKLLGTVLGEMERSPDKRMAWVVVTDELYQKTNTTSEDTDNFVNYVRSVSGVEVAILFRQTAPQQYKISLRSKGRVDISSLAQALGGGGHKNAAGSTLDGTLDDVRRKVLGEVAKVIVSQMGS